MQKKAFKAYGRAKHTAKTIRLEKELARSKQRLDMLLVELESAQRSSDDVIFECLFKSALQTMAGKAIPLPIKQFVEVLEALDQLVVFDKTADVVVLSNLLCKCVSLVPGLGVINTAFGMANDAMEKHRQAAHKLEEYEEKLQALKTVVREIQVELARCGKNGLLLNIKS